MSDELTQGEVRLRVHASADTNNRVRGKVFARQLAALIKALESADKAANGGVRHDYVITGLEQKSAQASLTQVVSSKKSRRESPVVLLPKIINAVRSSDTPTVIRFAEAVSSLRKMTKGAGSAYSHADLQVGASQSMRIDEFFEKQLSDALKVVAAASTPQRFYTGIAYGSFDGLVKEVDLRGDTPRLKLILTAGNIEVDCVTQGLSIEEIRSALDMRAWVDGKAFYNGSTALPERIEVTAMRLVSQKPDLLRWSGAFKVIDHPEWGYE